MNYKKALVTGGTSGVGLSIVKELVKHDFIVTFIGSNSKNGKTVESTLNNNSNVTHKFIQLDLSDLTKVKLFTEQFSKENDSLDLLVNVAGIMSPKQQLTPTGLDKTFAIGYLSAFMLSNELTPLLEKGANSRIVNVGGQASHVLNANLDFEDLSFTKKYSGMKTAISTIHAKTVLTQILAEKLIRNNIDVNSFHPGTVKSNLTRNMPLPIKLIVKLINPFLSKSSTNGIFTCLDEQINNVSGKLFVNKKPTDLSFEFDYRQKLLEATQDIINRY